MVQTPTAIKHSADLWGYSMAMALGISLLTIDPYCAFVTYNAKMSRNLAEILPPGSKSYTESLGNVHRS